MAWSLKRCTQRCCVSDATTLSTERNILNDPDTAQQYDERRPIRCIATRLVTRANDRPPLPNQRAWRAIEQSNHARSTRARPARTSYLTAFRVGKGVSDKGGAVPAGSCYKGGDYAGETGSSGAEGATAPETLRQKNRIVDELWKEARAAPADGITFSGKSTEGAPTIGRNGRAGGAAMSSHFPPSGPARGSRQ